MAGELDPIHRNNQQPDISGSSSPSHSDSGSSPDRPFSGTDKDGQYDRQLLEVLVDEISSVTNIGNGCDSSPETKKRKRELQQTVQWLRVLATNPMDPELVIREKEKLILLVRREMFVKIEDVADLDSFPSFSSLRKRKKEWRFSDERYKSKRRSERIARSFTLSTPHLMTLRKRIGIGELFQANIPDWMGPPSDKSYKTDPNVSKYLGTTSKCPQNIKKLRPVLSKCNCTVPGSVQCVSYHVGLARTRLRSELGKAFFSWGFDLIGKEVNNSILTREEQVLFESLERGEGGLEGFKGFWSGACKYLKGKARRDLVRYFFNVYLMMRVGWQSRTRPVNEIDSDEEDCLEDLEEGDDVDGERGVSVISSPVQRSKKPRTK